MERTAVPRPAHLPHTYRNDHFHVRRQRGGAVQQAVPRAEAEVHPEELVLSRQLEVSGEKVPLVVLEVGEVVLALIREMYRKNVRRPIPDPEKDDERHQKRHAQYHCCCTVAWGGH